MLQKNCLKRYIIYSKEKGEDIVGNFGGNLQKIKNGKKTYGITPHIPGGFVTPNTLIKIAEVAKKYKGVL